MLRDAISRYGWSKNRKTVGYKNHPATAAIAIAMQQMMMRRMTSSSPALTLNIGPILTTAAKLPAVAGGRQVSGLLPAPLPIGSGANALDGLSGAVGLAAQIDQLGAQLLELRALVPQCDG